MDNNISLNNPVFVDSCKSREYTATGIRASACNLVSQLQRICVQFHNRRGNLRDWRIVVISLEVFFMTAS